MDLSIRDYVFRRLSTYAVSKSVTKTEPGLISSTISQKLSIYTNSVSSAISEIKQFDDVKSKTIDNLTSKLDSLNERINDKLCNKLDAIKMRSLLRRCYKVAKSSDNENSMEVAKDIKTSLTKFSTEFDELFGVKR